jgi:hypothetical protein
MNGRAPDFLRPQRQPRTGWILLAVGTLAMVAALYVERRCTLQHVAADHAQQQAAADLARQAPPRPVEPTALQHRADQVQHVLRNMRDPWLPTLRAIESATVSPVFLLSLDIDPTKGLVKLDAEAPSFDHALAYVQMLEEGGFLRPAQLVSHESAVDGASGRNVVRFSVATQWVPR